MQVVFRHIKDALNVFNLFFNFAKYLPKPYSNNLVQYYSALKFKSSYGQLLMVLIYESDHFFKTENSREVKKWFPLS